MKVEEGEKGRRKKSCILHIQHRLTSAARHHEGCVSIYLSTPVQYFGWAACHLQARLCRTTDAMAKTDFFSSLLSSQYSTQCSCGTEEYVCYFIFFTSRVEQQKGALMVEMNDIRAAVEEATLEKVFPANDERCKFVRSLFVCKCRLPWTSRTRS